jgi:hypothetical protein
MTGDEINMNIGLVDPDLLMQLRRNGVSDAWIAALGKASFTTVRKFQMFGESEAGVREACGVFGYLPTDGIDAFSQIASLKAAWSASRIMQTVEDQHRAEKTVTGVPNTLKPADYTATRMAFERAHGKTEDEMLPGVTIIEMMEADLEGGEFNTPHLNEIPSKAEVLAASKGKSDTIGLSVTFSSTGAKLSQPVKVKLAMPTSTEEFRDRIHLLFSAIEFIKVRHPTMQSWLSSTEGLWNSHMKYFLGRKCWAAR